MFIGSIPHAGATLTGKNSAQFVDAVKHLHAVGTHGLLRSKQINPPRIVRRREAAARLGCSTRAIDKLCYEGVLEKIKLPGRTRCCGIVESSLNGLIDQRNVATD